MIRVTASVRHMIDITIDDSSIPLSFTFVALEIGGTQATTITYGGAVVAQYAPGTRHWGTALETAERVLARAMQEVAEQAIGRHYEWKSQAVIAGVTAAIPGVLAVEGCTPWDGGAPRGWGEEEA